MQNENPRRLLWIMGLAMTLPMILLGGPLAGFLIGQWVLVDRLKMNPVLAPVLMIIGLIGSGLQAFQLIKKIKESSKKGN